MDGQTDKCKIVIVNEQTVERVLTVRENHWEKITFVLKQALLSKDELYKLDN